MNIPCIKCKGATPMQSCGRTFCPIIAKSRAMFKVKDKVVGENFSGSSPAVLVGHFGYPNVNVGILSPNEVSEDAWIYDAPKYWAEHNFQIPELIDYRSSLINSRFKLNVHQQNRFLDVSQEVGMASKPVDVEFNLKQKPKFKLNTDAYHAPTGPNAELKKVKITENPRIDYKVDKVVSDTDLKAREGIEYLYEHGFDDNFLSKILSVGILGIKNQRKLVPLRWSITASHDMIAKKLMKEIKEFETTDYLAFFGSYIGNYYLILMFPEVYSYELFETYMPKAEWNISNECKYMTDYEPYDGRKSYAENCGGGFYSVRLGIMERLRQMKRQASVLAFRFITGEYTTPLGVWVTLNSAKNALQNKPLEFNSKELMLKYAKNLVKRKFNYDLERLLKESVLLKNLKTQQKLSQWT